MRKATSFTSLLFDASCLKNPPARIITSWRTEIGWDVIHRAKDDDMKLGFFMAFLAVNAVVTEMMRQYPGKPNM